MAKSLKSARSILRFQAAGFCAMIGSILVVEFFHIPHLLYGVPADISIPRTLIRLSVVLAIWGFVHFTTRRLLRRLHELEGFLRVCSWCRRVGDQGEWMVMEEYFNSRLATETSHGICPDCAQRQLAAQRSAMRVIHHDQRPPD
jgi:hypothetical protein